MITSLYILYRASTASLYDALVEVAFFAAIGFCMYLSYRLILVINSTIN